ncbi:MAG: GIY-YIG nuclease family protein [Candidatus Gorgyraea atricola]|nr:GIY-YIG nuclease family protein [Candidatus Gorgyraea atricola]
MWYVYLIKSIKFKYRYIGSSNDVYKRLEEHNKGICKASNPYKPFKLISYIAVEDKNKAIELERYLKTGSGSAFLKKRIL